MIGIIFACLAGAFLTLQSTANAAIGGTIGTWQAAALTQGTGFIAALLIAVLVRDRSWQHVRKVTFGYRFGGALAAFVIFSNITAYHLNGAALTVSAVLIAQIVVTLGMEKLGWFGPVPPRMRSSQWVGLGCMVAGILCLTL